jgi:glycine cleavage system aminomethyltransferase T
MTLDDTLRQHGAREGELDGTPVPLGFSTLSAEVRAVRERAGLSALPHITCLRVGGEGAADALAPLCPVDLSLPIGTLRHTLLLEEDGRPFVDLYLGHDEDGFLLLAEGAGKGALTAFLRAHLAARARIIIEDLGASHVTLSLQGPFAWEVLAELEGPEILGFPHLSFYRPTERRSTLRTERTGEFGYDLLVPRAEADRYFDRLLDAGAPFDVIPVGIDALAHAALEDGVFNIHREGRAGLTPIELGLEGRMDGDGGKEFLGKAALLRRKAAGSGRRLTALTGPAPFAEGDAVRAGGRPIGTVLTAARSITLGDHIGLGIREASEMGDGGDRFTVESAGDARPVRVVSRPFVNNLSLFVDPEQHSYHDQSAIDFPGPRRSPAGGPFT